MQVERVAMHRPDELLAIALKVVPDSPGFHTFTSCASLTVGLSTGENTAGPKTHSKELSECDMPLHVATPSTLACSRSGRSSPWYRTSRLSVLTSAQRWALQLSHLSFQETTLVIHPHSPRKWPLHLYFKDCLPRPPMALNTQLTW